jgi:hypothetical protein
LQSNSSGIFFFKQIIFGFFVQKLPLLSLILISLLFPLKYALASDATFTLPDTSLRQGTRWKLPVFLQSNGTAMQEICTIRMAIPKKRIILHDALTEPGTLYTCKKTTITFLSDGDEYKEYAITCPNPLFDSSGIALYLDMETLAGMDSTLSIKVISFSIGDSIQDIEQIGGKITFIDPAVIQASSEGMDINSPNPFAYTTSFNYYVAKPGNVQFFLYGSQGKLVKEFPVERKIAGRHSFTLNVDNPMDFSSGVYIIRMKTEQGLYHMSMVHKK